MSAASSLLAFASAAVVLTITPGLDTALVLRIAASDGQKKAALAALGIAAGCFTWAVFVALGFGILLETSAAAFTFLKWIGAAYLISIGLPLLVKPSGEFRQNNPSSRITAPFAKGALTNILNPKVGLFYISFLPQFVPPGVQVAPFIMLLGLIHVGLGLIWFGCLILATLPIRRTLERPAIVTTLNRATGGLFVSLGVGLAADKLITGAIRLR